MTHSLSKTDFLLFLDCPKNAWLKIYKPDVYYAHELSEFEKAIIETGNEVDILARELFPDGEFQKKFETDGYLAITDVLKKDEDGVEIFEVKATNSIDKKWHLPDLSFQAILLEKLGEKISSANIVHLNKEYVRGDELDIRSLFQVEDVTEKIDEMKALVEEQMKKALAYLREEKEPAGPCSCIYKGRSNHCTTFSYSNPDIPEYGVHDLVRIGLSKKKLVELVDGNHFHFEDLPPETELSDSQKNQIHTYLYDRVIQETDKIRDELEKIVFPVYFLDYETSPAAIPRFKGFSPYVQIPFQYSLFVLDKPDAEPRHFEFIYTEQGDPTEEFAKSLMKNIGPIGSIVVWHKDFECGRNRELGKRYPECLQFMQDLEKRIFDLEEIFKKQLYVHRDFQGSSSIKYVLPVLVPELTYKDLAIQEGGAASTIWNKIVKDELNKDEKAQAIENLKEYCKRDTYAMYAIWKKLHDDYAKYP